MRALRRSRIAPLNSGLASVPTAASQIAHSTTKCTSPLPAVKASLIAGSNVPEMSTISGAPLFSTR